MSHDLIDTFVMLLAFIGGIAVSAIDNPLTGSFLLVGVMAFWEITKKFAFHSEHSEQA